MDNLITEAKALLNTTFSHVRHAAAMLVGLQVAGVADLNALEASNPLVKSIIDAGEAEGAKLGLPEHQIAIDFDDLMATAKAISTMQTPVDPVAAPSTEPAAPTPPATEAPPAVAEAAPAAETPAPAESVAPAPAADPAPVA